MVSSYRGPRKLIEKEKIFILTLPSQARPLLPSFPTTTGKREEEIPAHTQQPQTGPTTSPFLPHPPAPDASPACLDSSKADAFCHFSSHCRKSKMLRLLTAQTLPLTV